MKKQTKLSDILKAMKKIVERRPGRTYLCFLLSGFYEYRIPGNRDQKYYLRKWLREMLGNHATLEEWLLRNHPNIYEPFAAGAGRKSRLAWLDWMIAECEKTGD